MSGSAVRLPASHADVAPEDQRIIDAAWAALVTIYRRRNASADYLAGALALYATLIGRTPNEVRADMLRMYARGTPIGRRLREGKRC